MHLAGYNVFVMPKTRRTPRRRLLQRHRDIVRHIAGEFNDTIGVYGEGLGGYVAYYLALAHIPVGSIVCENALVIMTEPAYHLALLTDAGPWSGAARRHRGHLADRPPPGATGPSPPRAHLMLSGLEGPGGHRRGQPGRGDSSGRRRYLYDPDFDRWYPLSAVTSLLSTPPPGALDGDADAKVAELATADRGYVPSPEGRTG